MDNIRGIYIKRLDGSAGRISAYEVAEACQLMFDGVYKYGAHLAGFKSETLQNCRLDDHTKHFDTGYLDLCCDFCGFGKKELLQHKLDETCGHAVWCCLTVDFWST